MTLSMTSSIHKIKICLYKSALNFYTDSSGAAYQPGYFFSSDSLSLTSLRKSNPGFSPRLPKTIFNELLYKTVLTIQSFARFELPGFSSFPGLNQKHLQAGISSTTAWLSGLQEGLYYRPG
jgi:hypothetical protein